MSSNMRARDLPLDETLQAHFKPSSPKLSAEGLEMGMQDLDMAHGCVQNQK